MNADKRDELIDTYFRVLDELEYEPLLKAFARDVQYMYPGGEHLKGLDEVMEYFKNRHPTKDSDHTVTRRHHTEDVSVVEGHFTGRVTETGSIRADF